MQQIYEDIIDRREQCVGRQGNLGKGLSSKDRGKYRGKVKRLGHI